MINQNIDGITYKLAKPFDFSFLKKYGRVFKVFDDQDSGNICFGVDNTSERLFIKFAGAPTAEYSGNYEDAIARLKATIPIYESLKHNALIRYIDSEEIGGGFAMIFAWSEGECMGRMYEDSHEKIMSLPISDKLNIFEQIIDFLIYVASKSYLAIDFYDGSVMYDFDTKRVTICDIDFFRAKPVINDMGQMWGSPRFISPEECTLGEALDEITNVFTIGRMGFSLFTDSEYDLEQWPYSNETYQVLKKAASEKRADRYQTLNDFKAHWKDAVMKSAQSYF